MSFGMAIGRQKIIKHTILINNKILNFSKNSDGFTKRATFGTLSISSCKYGNVFDRY